MQTRGSPEKGRKPGFTKPKPDLHIPDFELPDFTKKAPFREIIRYPKPKPDLHIPDF